MTNAFTRMEPGRRAALLVVAVVAVILVPIIIVMWPGEPVNTTGSSVSQEYPRATLSDVTLEGCDEVTDEVPCGEATGTLRDGTEVEVSLYRNAHFNGVHDGDKVVLYGSTFADGDTIYTYYSPQRGWTLGAFALGALALVILGAGSRGLRAFVSLIGSAFFIWVFLVAGIAANGSPLLYTSVTTMFLLTGVLYYTHGLSAKTLAAWIGTMAGLAVAMGVGSLLSWMLRLGPADESASALTLTGLTVSVETVALSALLIVLIGILNDIAAAQASTVFSHAQSEAGADDGDSGLWQRIRLIVIESVGPVGSHRTRADIWRCNA